MTPPHRNLSDYATRYAALPFEEVQVAYRRRLVLDVLAECGAKRVLEVGCGLEPLAAHAPSFDAWTIVEPAATFAAAAVEQVAGDSRVRVLVDTIEGAVGSGALVRGAFDVVILSSLLHEVPSPEEVLRGVRSLCDGRTLVHCNVPNATSLHRELAVAMGLIPDVATPSPQQVALQQRRIFDARSLERLVEGAGFAVASSGGYLVKPFTHAQMAALVSGGTIDRQVLEGLYVLGRKFPEFASEIFVNARSSGPQ